MNESLLTEINRALVEDFADLFYAKKNVREAFMKYAVKDYIQHNWSIADGRQAAIDMREPKFYSPHSTFSVKRILVDGDLAAIHLHGSMSPDHPGGAVVDIFRIKDKKIVELWDVLQVVPTGCVNPHPMFF
jgi:predicted SnoaL-like aldol condensation-catalyzing enzyme